MMTRKILVYLLIHSPGHQFPAPWHDVHRSSDGAHQLSGGAIELHSQGSPVGESKQHVPAPGCPVGRGSGPYGNITFYNKQLNLPREMEGLSDQGWEVMEYFDEVHSGATLCFDTWSLRRWSLT